MRTAERHLRTYHRPTDREGKSPNCESVKDRRRRRGWRKMLLPFGVSAGSRGESKEPPIRCPLLPRWSDQTKSTRKEKWAIDAVNHVLVFA